MSRSRRFDKRDFWDGSKVDRKQTQKVKKKDRKIIQSQSAERRKREIDGHVSRPGEIDGIPFDELDD